MVSFLSTETDRFNVADKLNLLNFDEQLLGLIWYESFVHTYSNAASYWPHTQHYIVLIVVQLSQYELLFLNYI